MEHRNELSHYAFAINLLDKMRFMSSFLQERADAFCVRENAFERKDTKCDCVEIRRDTEPREGV